MTDASINLMNMEEAMNSANELRAEGNCMRVWEDVIGRALEGPDMLRQAMLEEIVCFRMMGVYPKVPEEERTNATGKKFIGVR